MHTNLNIYILWRLPDCKHHENSFFLEWIVTLIDFLYKHNNGIVTKSTLTRLPIWFIHMNVYLTGNTFELNIINRLLYLDGGGVGYVFSAAWFSVKNQIIIVLWHEKSVFFFFLKFQQKFFKKIACSSLLFLHLSGHFIYLCKIWQSFLFRIPPFRHQMIVPVYSK